MPRRLCIICRERPATVPDRNRMGRLINRVCSPCHAARLAKDLQHCLDAHTREQQIKAGCQCEICQTCEYCRPVNHG